MPFLQSHPVRIQPYFGYRNAERLRISARALRSRAPKFRNAGRLRAFRTMLSQFASKEVGAVSVTLEIKRADGARFSHHAESDPEGFVHFDVPLEGEWRNDANTRWELVTLTWENSAGTQRIHGHVLSPGGAVPLGVISDIDDTIVETGITGNLRSVLRNWKRVLAQWPEERIAVPAADVFYGALGGGLTDDHGGASTGEAVPATHHPFFYVSSSPWNLFSYLVTFKRQRGLPLGPIHLRDWGLNLETFGSSSHGSHKVEAIKTILDSYPGIDFAFVGDDTQKDLVAFGAIASEYANQVKAIFIRRAANEAFSPEELSARQSIEENGIPLWLGEDYSTGKRFLAQIGLDTDYNAERVVETVRHKTA